MAVGLTAVGLACGGRTELGVTELFDASVEPSDSGLDGGGVLPFYGAAPFDASIGIKDSGLRDASYYDGGKDASMVGPYGSPPPPPPPDPPED